MMVQNIIIFSSQIITLLTFSIGIYVLYGLIASNKIKTTQGIVLVLILGQFLNNFLYVSSGFIHNVVYRLGVIEASKKYMEHIFNRKNKRNEKTGITDGNIMFKDVKFRYDTEKEDWLFTDLNVHFEAGERYAIVGQSGGGKTTMMKMVAGLYVPEGGSIYIDNLDIKNADLEYLRENVNYMNQRTTLFNETILYNMQYGNPDATEEQIVDVLNKYDLLDVFKDLPEGIHANAGIQGGNLSGGMQRVTMLIRGLLKPGQIVIMDEPTTGLDKESTDKVKKLIFEETEGKTLIIITHSSVMLSSMRVLDMLDLKG
jgi:ABC-type bacteriocin/lantibiotic exporter with double-glycine peptidase domain